MLQPVAALGGRAPAEPVWHCAVRAAPGDPDLGDGAWMRIAEEIMHRTGLSRYGEEDDGVRWAAVHHGGNHIHIAATLARQDACRAHLHNEYYRIGEALRDLEAEYGLVAVARAPGRAETEKAARAGQGEPPRVTLRRHVQAAAAAARWRARYTDPDGKEHSKSFDKKVDADRFLTEVEHSKLTGSYLDPDAGRVTLGSRARLWLDSLTCDPTTRHHIELRVQRHILPALGHRRLDVLTRSPSIIQAWAANLPVGPSYAQ
jgi:hypothetical protein